MSSTPGEGVSRSGSGAAGFGVEGAVESNRVGMAEGRFVFVFDCAFNFPADFVDDPLIFAVLTERDGVSYDTGELTNPDGEA